LKVLILHTDFRVYWKGRLHYLKSFLNEKGIDFYAIELFGKGSPYEFDQFENAGEWWTCLFPDKSVRDLSADDIKHALFSKLDEINPDIIIGGSIVFFSGALGIRWAKQHRKKFIMFDDGKPSHIKRNFLTQSVKDMITKQVDGLWLPSPEYDAEYSNLNKDKVLFFHGYNCIDNQLFKSTGKRGFNNKVIICVARLVPVKNFDALLNAWKIVEGNDTGYKLIIVGQGPEYEALTQLVTDSNLQHVEFKGAIGNTELPEYYHNADAFILPSLYESWGLVVNEAMAAGLPVLLSKKINAYHSLLQEGVNGFGFDPLNINDVAGAIMNYINLDADGKENMSQKSLQIINTMSYENMGLELFSAINKIIEKEYKSTGILAGAIINSWNGKYDTWAWDTL